MLEGKRLLITGVLTRGSIAFEVARQAQEEGAAIVLTGFGRGMRLTERAADVRIRPRRVLELDVNQPDDLARVAGAEDSARAGAPWTECCTRSRSRRPDALGGGFLDTPASSAITAFDAGRLVAEGAGCRAGVAAGGCGGRRFGRRARLRRQRGLAGV